MATKTFSLLTPTEVTITATVEGLDEYPEIKASVEAQCARALDSVRIDVTGKRRNRTKAVDEPVPAPAPEGLEHIRGVREILTPDPPADSDAELRARVKAGLAEVGNDAAQLKLVNTTLGVKGKGFDLSAMDEEELRKIDLAIAYT